MFVYFLLRRFLKVALVSLCVVLSSCGTLKTGKLDKTARLPDSEVAPASNSEAYAATRDIVLPRYFVQCSNEKIYTKTSGLLLEIKGLRYEAFPAKDAPLSPPPVDAANGIAWKGFFTLGFGEMHRQYDRLNNKWSLYEEGTGTQSLTFDLAKVDGEWVCNACRSYAAPDCNNEVYDALTKGKKASAIEEVGNRTCWLGFVVFVMIGLCLASPKRS